jgi:DNA-binding transcriptional ArsR family regulator
LTGIFPHEYTQAMNTAYLTALAEPNRMRIVELLRDGPRPVGEIAVRLRLHQPQASKHLRVLSEAGIVKVQAVAQQRFYRLEGKPFEEMDSWVETFRRIWETRLDSLDEYLQELKKEQKRSKK